LREIQEQRLRLLQERERRQNMPINLYTPDSDPSRDQLSFHQSNARYRLAFGGNRAGKSVVTSYEVAAQARGCHRFRKNKPGPKEIYVISAEYRTIYMGIHRHLDPARDGMKFIDRTWIKETGPKIPGAMVDLPAYIKIWCTHHTDGTPVNPTDPDRPFSTIWFISGDGGEQARKKVQAAAIDIVVIDEEIGQDIYDELMVRILDKDGELCISCTLVRSEDWLLELEDRAEENERDEDGNPIVTLVRLNTETSRHISARAKKEILGRLSPEERAVRVEGRSRRAFGLVFPRFGPEHTFDVHKDFPDGFPKNFIHVAATDPGFRVHAGLWCAVDPSTSTLYFWKELYEREANLQEVCEQIAAVEGCSLVPIGQEGPNLVYKRHASVNAINPDARLIDPEAVRHFEDGRPGIAAQMISFYDTLVIPANNNVQAGVEAGRRMLEINPLTSRPHALFDWRLKEFFSERRKYKIKRDTSGRNAHATRAEPLRKDNHLMDVYRYICIHVLSTLFGEKLEEHRRRGVFNHSLEFAVATDITERLEEQWSAIRSKTPVTPLGSEW
jgi:phage terminase large subunit-like protein